MFRLRDLQIPPNDMLPFLIPELSGKESSLGEKKASTPQTSAPAIFKAVHQIFDERVALNPSITCFVHGTDCLTFNEVNNRANQLASYLKAVGITKNQFVPLCIEAGFDFVISMLAIFKAGAVYVPIDALTPPDRITFILKDLAATCVVCSAQTLNLFKDFTVEAIDVNDRYKSDIDLQPTSNLLIEINPTDLAYIIYTSGSTGKPKGVMIEHQAFHHYITNNKTKYINADGNKSGSYIYLSNAFDASLTALFMPMIAGKMAVIAHKNKSEVFEDPNFIKYAPYDFLKITPAHLDFLASTLQLCNNNEWVTKRLVIGGEALYAGQLEAFNEHKIALEVINEYGPTEATVGCTTFALEIKDCYKYKKSIPIGVPIDNTCIYLFDDKNGTLQPSDRGEIYIGGSGLARGYLNRIDLTEEKFIINPIRNSPYKRLYKTGDLGKWLPDGNLLYEGRIDDQVKIAGYRIELGEIENEINALSFINNCCVLARQQGITKQIVCFYVPNNTVVNLQQLNNNLDNYHKTNEVHGFVSGTYSAVAAQLENEIYAALKQSLPDYMLPSQYIMLSKLPLTNNGKIDKKALFSTSLKKDLSTQCKQVYSPVEAKLLKIFRKVLGNSNYTPSDVFFELGGNSLYGAAIINLINRQFGTHLPLTTLINAPTISKLAIALQNVDHRQEEQCIYPFKRSGAWPPLYLLHAGAGDILFYHDLANLLSEEQPVFGIMAKGLTGKQMQLNSIPKLAGFYVDEILKTHTGGPIRLAGYCFGAVLCYEMAIILKEKGVIVDFLASINGISPGYVQKAGKQMATVVDYGKGLKGKLTYHYKKIKTDGLLYIPRHIAGRTKHKLKDFIFTTSYNTRLKLYDYFLRMQKPMPALLARKFYFDTNHNMVDLYKPGKYNGVMHVFRSPAIFTEPSLGWKNYVLNKIYYIEIYGYHENRRAIMNKPYVIELAKKFNECLANVSLNR